MKLPVPGRKGEPSDSKLDEYVRVLIELAWKRRAASEGELVKALVERAIPRPIALRLVVLGPIVFGQNVLSSLGIEPTETVVLDRKGGEGTETRRLDSFAEYRALMRAIPTLADHPGAAVLAESSEHVNQVKIAARRGADVAKVKLTPVRVLWDIR